MVEGISVKKVSRSELDQVKRIADKQLREDYSTDLFRFFFEEHRQSFFVAVDHQAVVGFVLAVPMDHSTLRILMLAVDGDRSSMGIGSALIERCKKYARERMMNSIVLEVGTSNTRAIDFYHNRGFKMIRILKGYYKDNTDAFVMKLYLPA